MDVKQHLTVSVDVKQHLTVSVDVKQHLTVSVDVKQHFNISNKQTGCPASSSLSSSSGTTDYHEAVSLNW